MNKWKYGFLILLLVAVSVPAQVFGPAVTVNGQQISREKVRAQVDHMINQRGLNSGGITQPAAYKQLQEEVVDQMIVQELMWQEAKSRDFVVADELVDERLKKMKRGFDTEQAFLFKIKEGGFTEASYREDIRQQESVRRMVSEGLAVKIKFNEEDVEKFYNANIEQMRSPVEVHARHILIKPSSTALADHQAAKQEADGLLSQARGGADFEELAKTHSQGPSASNGGDLGYFGSGQMVPAFEQTAFALQPGEVSEIVQTQFGYHIIKLEARRGGETATLDRVKERIESYLGQRALQKAVEDLVNRLREQGEVNILLN